MATEDQRPADDQNPLPGDDEQVDFGDFSQVSDAGESEDMTAAKQEAAQVKMNMQHRAKEKDESRMEAYGEENIVKRAKILANLQAFKFVHFKPVKDEFIMQARTDSEMNRLAVFDALFDYAAGTVPYPHYDTFRGRLVDHRGEVFTMRNIDIREILEAVNWAGLENPSSKQVAESYRDWALRYKVDGLVDNFDKMMPEWDEKERLETLLIELFRPFDTRLNRLIGKYFWLSLYNRIQQPGCNAPISLALIGAQYAGKSYFSKLICRTLMDDPTAAPIPLDFAARNYNPFLRNITGRSIIANVGEMTGFKKADIERMKDFATKTEDDLDFKFEDTIVKPRQWIVIMDGNEYSGLQRDDTGNRRFYPIFVGQEADKDGAPSWSSDFRADFSNFRSDLWQVMSECKKWMEINGDQGYAALVNEASMAVSEFSKRERSQARGVVRDDLIDDHLVNVLICCDYQRHLSRGWFVKNATISLTYGNMMHRAPHTRTLAPHMSKLGFEAGTFQNQRGYFLPFELDDKGAAKTKDLTTLLAKLLYNPEENSSIEELKQEVNRLRKSNNENDF